MTTITLAYSAVAILSVAAILLARHARIVALENAESFVVANRRLPWIPMALSIAATWIWAPALFLGAQQAFNLGLAGLFWFVVPNALALVLFGYLIPRLRAAYPRGYTLSGFMQDVYSRRVGTVYRVQLLMLATASFAVNLLGGGLILNAVTGIPFVPLVTILAVVAVAYSILGGIRGGVLTDYWMMLFMLLVTLTLVPAAIHASGGIPAMLNGLSGTHGTGGSILDSHAFWVYGLINTLGLLSGPWGDQSFYQRMFSLPERHVRKAFYLAAPIFAVVPLGLGLLGFAARGSGLVVPDAQLTAVTVIQGFLPVIALLPFLIAVLAGLTSTLNSMLTSTSSITGTDFTAQESLRAARRGIIIVAIIGFLVAILPGMTILYLALSYGTLRASTMMPTILTLLKVRTSERGMFWGILGSLAIGWPIFIYGQWNGITSLAVVGSLTVLLLSAAGAHFIPERRSA